MEGVSDGREGVMEEGSDGREGGREGEREGVREGERKGVMEGGREGGSEGVRDDMLLSNSTGTIEGQATARQLVCKTILQTADLLLSAA